ncbi:MAG: hypothetical protein IT373_37395 [Polyangiaceae bacterium]|nr:hypothetical protein [Polyangiaceae bacterium]
MLSRLVLGLAWGAAALAPALVLGCTYLDADDYSRSCSSAMECQVVLVGDPCDCACESSAINVADYPQYLEDRGKPSCNKQCEPCAEVSAACIDRVCEAVP